VAYDQLNAAGPNTLATAGPVIGDYQGVRDAILAAEELMFTQNLKPKASIKKATKDANAVIKEYNSRIGA
jgi:hypothetical protein